MMRVLSTEKMMTMTLAQHMSVTERIAVYILRLHAMYYGVRSNVQ